MVCHTSTETTNMQRDNLKHLIARDSIRILLVHLAFWEIFPEWPNHGSIDPVRGWTMLATEANRRSQGNLSQHKMQPPIVCWTCAFNFSCWVLTKTWKFRSYDWFQVFILAVLLVIWTELRIDPTLEDWWEWIHNLILTALALTNLGLLLTSSIKTYHMYRNIRITPTKWKKTTSTAIRCQLGFDSFLLSILVQVDSHMTMMLGIPSNYSIFP